jgi:alpha-acetolactate decarboxylase
MKKLIVLVAFLVASTASYAQSFFDTLEDMDGVDVVVVTKDAFEMLSKFKNIKIEDNETMKVFSMIQELKELKVFTTDDAEIANKMDKMVSKAIKSQNLTELMRVKDDDSRVKIYVKASKNKDFVSEVLMFIKGINKKTKENVDSVIVSLTGNIDINKMSELADTFVKEANKK